MDFRSPRPERDAVPRPEPGHTSRPAEPQPKKETPRTVQHIGSSHHVAKEDKSKKTIITSIIVVIVIIVALIAGFLIFSKMKGGDTGIDKGKYQAVFFTNGQVYFGKLQLLSEDTMKLTDVFYLQTQSDGKTENSDNLQETSTNQNKVQLIKLGDEVHGPEDAMIVSRDQVLFYENLKTDGKVAQTINDYHNKQ